MSVNKIMVSSVRSVDDRIACSCLHPVTQTSADYSYQRVSEGQLHSIYTVQVTAPQSACISILREGRLQRLYLAQRIKMFKRLGMDSDTADTTDMVHNIIIIRRRGGHTKLNSTLICIFLQPIRLARQAGHRSLLQTTFEAKSSKKKAFNLKSKDDIFLINLIFLSGNSCQIFG